VTDHDHQVAEVAPMTQPHVTFDAKTGNAYISLAKRSRNLVETSVPLWPVDDQPDTLASLVLDFDADGRLVGIKVLDPADRVLHGELLNDIHHASAHDPTNPL
jgi:hypothetical protein